MKLCIKKLTIMKFKKILPLLILLVLVFGAFFLYRMYGLVFNDNTAFEENEVVLYIPTGSSFSQLQEQLRPLVKDLEAFTFVAKLKDYPARIKPGKYILINGMSCNELVNTLRSGNVPINVTFNNQETIASLAGRIAAQIEADSISLYNAMTSDSFLESQGLNANQALAIYIPNTYKLKWNTSADEFRNRMLLEYQKFWNPERIVLAKKQGLSPEQVITLASIVHKETVKADERPRVAGVYLNRLNRNMPLQADPTVIFALKKMRGDFNTVIRRVLLRDLELNSPFNTYKFGGLPPGPIAMPDISAIDAVLNPEIHDYLFFVADTSNFGYHLFAETLGQHNRNKKQYHNWVNTQKILR
ncbi:MAG: endolytic transglycosylase MltG [Bacteroidota bacterium]